MSFPKVSVEGDLSALPAQLVDLVNEHFPFVSINQDKKADDPQSESDGDEKARQHRHHHHHHHDGAWAHGMGHGGRYGYHPHGRGFGARGHHGHGHGFPPPPPGPADAEGSAGPNLFPSPDGFPFHGKGGRGGFCKRGGKGMKGGRCTKGKSPCSSDDEGNSYGRGFAWAGPWAGPCFGPFEGGKFQRHGRHGRKGPRPFFGSWDQDSDTDNESESNIKSLDGQTISVKYDHAVGGYKVPVDIHENKDSFLLVLSLPGVKKEEIFIDYSSSDNELSFAGCIVDISDAQKYTKISNTRSLGHFSTKVALPSSIPIDESSIRAKSSNGVLKVYVMKDLAATKSTRVSVEQGGDSSEEVDEVDSVAAQTERTTLNEKNEEDDPSESTPGIEGDDYDAVVVDVDVE